ncbi:leucine--tRNA ligase [Candidatus Neoehrlichia procyonis]|uniref:Leucine--tRNA ligase n=1 Tax=Candidatus Neoehrlichia procyonis str. RAC413 TaxID=1359163 RepID=A0A0F3NKW4_9RICK|nr:leucine--tRNA ligase [Candidatus Neoehrlichia lotoris]KJV68693.1 leucine--tRNA ligase [Candidatus Neoehrlichia lotoris str. RAC413]
MNYDFETTEKEIQNKWNFDIKNQEIDYYILEMFPYPSGNIHMGHLRNYTIGDVISRYKNACGFNVLHPIGWDAFGLPAENAALSYGIHPREWTEGNINNMRKQLKSIGLSYNWDRELSTCNQEYYKYEQEFFLDFLHSGLAYRKESWVNWDPIDKTTLANEQVIDGKGWRSGALVEKRKLSQWFLRITDYAEELLNDLKNLKEWPEKVKLMQERWIGKSEGVTIKFEVMDYNTDLEIFTTMPHTLFGASFCAVSVDHNILELVKDLNVIKNIRNITQISCKILDKEDKIGVNTGLLVKHPLLDKLLPVYAVNFVLSDYGTGAIFGCPAHDRRDFEFAVKYNLPIIQVIFPIDNNIVDVEKEAYVGSGILGNSEFLNGMTVNNARESIITRLESMGKCKYTVNYKLHDWGISRQRYWGCPIPIIYCEQCGIVPVDKKDLPVTLPEDVDFSKTGNPIANHPTWKYVKCPTCGANAERETDTFDTFFESSWYFAAFCGTNHKIDNEACNKILPVNCYIGGIEHAILHLLYSRFFCRILTQCGYFNIKEPFSTLITQGMVCHATYQDKNGNYLFPEEAKEMIRKGEYVLTGRSEKMSKSKKNIIDPYEIIKKYGADAARLFVLSDTPIERDIEWSDEGIKGSWKYINRLWDVISTNDKINTKFDNSAVENQELEYLSRIHKILYDINNDFQHYRLNCVIARCREMTNVVFSMIEEKSISYSVINEGVCILLRVIEPFIPHVSEKLWEVIGGGEMLCNQKWPTVNMKLLINDNITIVVQVDGKFCKALTVTSNTDHETLKEISLNAAKYKIVNKEIKNVYVIPNKVVNIITK